MDIRDRALNQQIDAINHNVPFDMATMLQVMIRLGVLASFDKVEALHRFLPMITATEAQEGITLYAWPVGYGRATHAPILPTIPPLPWNVTNT